MVKVEHFLLDGKLCSDLHSADSTVLKGRQAGMGYSRPGAHRGPHHSQGRRISTDWLLVGQSASGEVVKQSVDKSGSPFGHDSSSRHSSSLHEIKLVKDLGTLSACIQFPDRQLDTVAQGPGDVDLECRRSPPPQLPSHPYS